MMVGKLEIIRLRTRMKFKILKVLTYAIWSLSDADMYAFGGELSVWLTCVAKFTLILLSQNNECRS
jgi:hypothetical protein